MNRFYSIFALPLPLVFISGVLLSGCNMGSGVKCSPWSCWTDPDSISSHDYDYPTFDEPSSLPPPASPSAFSQSVVPITDETVTRAPNGLLVKNTSGTFIRSEEGSGGFLLVEIDASNSALSCEVTLVARLDDEVQSANVVPVAKSGTFLAESLGTGCLSSRGTEGVVSGVAIFEVKEKPQNVVLTDLTAVTPDTAPANTVSIGGRQVSVRVVPYKKLLNVTIESPESDGFPILPLLLEGFVTSPYYLGINDIFETLVIDPVIMNLQHDEGARRITYDLAVTNSDALVFGLFLKLNFTAAREVPPSVEESD